MLQRITLIVLSSIFAASGVSALLFETLWFRQSGLAFGNGVWATSLVLSSFMAGLAVGNGLVSRFGSRIRRPVHLFALAEIAIGVSGVALVYWLPQLSEPLAPLLRSMSEPVWLANASRLVLAFLLLLMPAIAMGTTLPLLVAALSRRGPGFGSSLGWLYGWNTLGAVVGTLLAEVLLIEMLGVRGTAWIAGSLDLLAGGAALAMARLIESDPASLPTPPAAAWRSPPVAGWSIVGSSFLAGATLLALEVTWFRFLTLFVHPGPAAFSAMLATVLLGIALGGLTAGLWLHRHPTAFRHASTIAFAAGISVLLPYAYFDLAISAFDIHYAQKPLEIVILSMPLIFPTALLSGVLFTLTASALNDWLRQDIASAGISTMANTIGSGLGSLAAGFVLLPWLGIERTFLTLGCTYLVVALLLFPARRIESSELIIRRVAAIALITVAIFFPSGRMRDVYLAIATEPFGTPEREQIVAVREGRSQTVVYLQSSLYGEPVYHRLVTGGFSMSTSGELARRYMKLFVYWPIAMNPDASRALLISYGVGATAKSLTDTKSLEAIDIVDISHEVLELSEIVHPGSESPLVDPRVKVHIEDGRHFLQLTESRYDLITAEPPPPRHAGVANLYSREYFQLIRDRLNEGGIATYWLPVHSMTSETSRAITRAFCDVFPSCSMWAGFAQNWMLVGINGEGETPTEEAMSRQWRDPEVMEELRAVGVERVEQLGALFMADAEQLDAFMGDALPVVDNYPKRIEDRNATAKDNELYAEFMNVKATRARFESSAWARENWPSDLRERSLAYFDEQGLIDGVWSTPSLADRLENLHRILTQTDLRTLPIWMLGGSTDRIAAAQNLLDRGISRDKVLSQIALQALSDRDYEAAVDIYHRFREAGPDSETLAALDLFLALMAEREARADRLIAALPESIRADEDLHRFFDETFGISIASGRDMNEAYRKEMPPFQDDRAGG